MSTRAMYTFSDERGTYHVYKHHDGYPNGAMQSIFAALGKAWTLPRFEADEFAAAFVAANKNVPGGVRLMMSGRISDVAPRDIEYHYEITIEEGELIVRAYEWVGGEWQSNKLFQGTLEKFERWAEAYEG